MMLIIKNKMLALMAAEGISTAQLAKELGISEIDTADYVKGKSKTPIEIATKLINLFGADQMSEVINWEAMHVSKPL